MTTTKKIPELLAPAGSPQALDAAIAGGADAVYFGGTLFNARINARNFSGDTLREAIDRCKLYGVKSNITLNTLVHEREIYDVLQYVEELYTLGADALIVADLGISRLIKHRFPDMELHASTQAAGHNTDAAKVFSELGFSRMVAARELSFNDLRTLCENSPIETEMFVHGAICVSQSGGCLASSLIGGRSGNRGECAQPCRLPYKSCRKNAKNSYALSLKDISLASHITDILNLGVASLKIEGRMKSPEYVYGVTSIYRRLLDEGRNASPEELSELKALFSRSGFTDGYFTKKTNSKMLGIRTDADKHDSASLKGGKSTDFSALLKERRRPMDMHILIEKEKPMKLCASVGNCSVTVQGPIPDRAVNQPLTGELVMKNLEKLGNTPFIAGRCTLRLDEGLIVPISALNALRRDAVSALSKNIACRRVSPAKANRWTPKYNKYIKTKTSRFLTYESVPAKHGCDIVYLPLEIYLPEMADKINGVIIPPVVFDSELATVQRMLKRAAESGIRHALVSNVGHIRLAKEAGMTIHGDFRLNIFNGYTAEVLSKLGFTDLLASPELTLPQLRDLGLPAVIYGRIPLMTLEKCVIRDLYSCEECKKYGLLGLRDRRNAEFILTRAFDHRNILYNSVPVFMQDKQDELIRYRVVGEHFIFTHESVETAEAILSGISMTCRGSIRRISK